METIAVIVGTLLVVLIAWLKGKDAGENQKDAEVLDNVAKAKKAADAVRATPADERRERLRKQSRK